MKRVILWICAVAAVGCVAFVAGWYGSGVHVLGRPYASSSYHGLKDYWSGKPHMPQDRDPPIDCWGDSLTSGYLATRSHSWPALLEGVFHRKTVNEGVPSQSSSQIKARMLARQKGSGPETAIIWAGRNNAFHPDIVISDIAEMVASLNPGSKYLVLGIFNGDFPDEQRGESRYQGVIKINAALKDTYGNRFVPLREILLSKGNVRFPEDAENLRYDVVPKSVRIDQIHLNDRGHAIVAGAVDDAFAALGW